MAFPLLAPLLAGGVISGLVQFFASRAGMILGGLGLTMVFTVGMQTFLGYAISDIQVVVSALQGGSGTSGLGGTMLQFAAFAGLFDGLNILISGFMSYGSLMAGKAVLSRLTGA